MKRKYSRVLPVVFCLLVCMVLSTVAMAASTSANFSVHLPRSIAITVNSAGNVVMPAAEKTRIYNASDADVKITSLAIQPSSGWSIADWDAGPAADSNQMSLKLLGVAAKTDGSFDLTSEVVIAAGSYIELAPEAKLSTGLTKQSGTIVGSLKCTVDWAEPPAPEGGSHTLTVDSCPNATYSPSSVTTDKNGVITSLPEVMPEDEYKFKGWTFTDSEGNTTEVKVGDTITSDGTLSATVVKLVGVRIDTTRMKQLLGTNARTIRVAPEEEEIPDTATDVTYYSGSGVAQTKKVFASLDTKTHTGTIYFNDAYLTNAWCLFQDYSTVKTIDLSHLDTSHIGTMEYMFSDCTALTSLDVSEFDTSSVGNTHAMFSGCSSLQVIDVSKFDMARVTNISNMFSECSMVSSLDVSNWDTSSVTKMGGAFYDCSTLKDLDVSGWNTSKVTDMFSMFSGCSSLQTLDMSRWDTSKVTDMRRMFEMCSMLKTVDVSNFDTSSVTNMSSMFGKCTALQSLDVSNWDVFPVTDMSRMFWHCSSLRTLDVSGWDTCSVTTMECLFYGCTDLEVLDVTNWDMTKVTDVSSMFRECSSLTSIGNPSWTLSAVTRIGGMFMDCSSLHSVDVSNWDLKRVTQMYGIFSGCSSLEALDVSEWNLSKVTNFDSVFSQCTSLKELDCSNWYVLNYCTMFGAFTGWSEEQTVYVGENSQQLKKNPGGNPTFTDK